MTNTELLSFRDGVQFAWDSTSITLATECQYKYYLKMIEGWTDPHLSVHLRFGQHFATALEHYHKHRFEGADYNQATLLVVKEALEATWDRTEDNPAGAPWVSNHNTKTRENLIRTIIWYLEQFRDDPMQVIVLANGKPAVELSFQIDIDDGNVLCGHLDRLVDYANDLMVTDNKTTGSAISQKYFDGYKPDIQMSTYTFAGKTVFNMPIKGVVIDAAQIMVGFSRFERGITLRSEDELSEWYDDTMYTIERTQRATVENYFPRNTTACGNYGGCQFRAACSRPRSVREQFLLADYVRGERWDPLKAR